MLPQEFIINRIERLTGSVDCKRQCDFKRFAEDVFDDGAFVALEHGALDAIGFDGSGGLQKRGTLRAMVGSDWFSHAGSIRTGTGNPQNTGGNGPKIILNKPFDTHWTID
jgi:hypothetical protein